MIFFDTEDFEASTAYGVILETVELPVKPAPELPPECWQTAPVDSERAMAAVRAMCGGL